MMGRTHQLIGATTAYTITAIADTRPIPTITTVLAAIAASRLPDTDLWLPGIRHRGPTHWIVTGIVVTTFVLFVAALFLPASAGYIAGGFAIGYGMHIVADACTLAGVPALAPFTGRDIHLLPTGMRVRTGGMFEGLVFALVALTGFVVLAIAYA
jgi:membrane-bound metal-dependent hydrolase YbcI (DUF457 family)